ncbi:MAG TPA: DUF4190 domain-containing protein [Acidimicrobiales bacterium]|nr:DUF4190 domain-containing protein [Acidimicrobiales bacterium]
MSMPPPPPPMGPSSYGSPYGGTRDHPQGILILVLGIASILCCGILGPVAWVMGNNAISEIDQNPAGYSNRGQVQAGRICGIVGTVLWALGILLQLAL